VDVIPEKAIIIDDEESEWSDKDMEEKKEAIPLVPNS